MNRPININSKDEEIHLSEGKYRIYIIGGWGGKIGRFKVLFKDKKTDKVVESRKAILSVQTYAFGEKAKRILIVDIAKSTGDCHARFYERPGVNLPWPTRRKIKKQKSI